MNLTNGRKLHRTLDCRGAERRDYKEQGQEFGFDTIRQLVEAVDEDVPIIDTDDSRFAEPGHMIEKIQTYLVEKGHSKPEEAGQLFKIVYHSLAHKYREVIGQLEEVVDYNFSYLHLIGGGSKSTYFSQLVADVTGKTVVTGLYEATSLGNALIQFKALGYIKDIAEAKEIVTNSVNFHYFYPEKRRSRMTNYPKIGIRPTIDGRQGGVRESLEEKTMAMAVTAKELIESNLRYADGTPVQCVVASRTIGGQGDAGIVYDEFSSQNIVATLSVTPSWCYGTETMDMDPHTIKAIWGFNGTERPGAVYLAAAMSGYAQKGYPAFKIYGHDVQDLNDNSIPDDVAEKILLFARGQSQLVR